MGNPNKGEIKKFIIEHLRDGFKGNDIDTDFIEDDFDLMKMGIIDSIGFIRLIGAIEDRFNIEVDFEEMEAEELTVIGSLAKFIAENARTRGL